MASLADYESGRIKNQIVRARTAMHFLSVPVVGRFVREKLQDRIRDFNLRCIPVETASDVIREARCCAAGERVCYSCSDKTHFSESVFLDELAEVMVASGQAHFVSGDEAVTTLLKYPDNPLVIARISGKDSEICCSYPKDCIYWNMKAHGFDF
jgi:hypothetical protein